MHQRNAQNLTLKPQMMNAKASRLTSIALSACVILTAHWGKSIFEVTGSSCLMQISLMRFFKKIHKYLPYANFGLFYFISAIFWAKIMPIF